ncbi:MAG: GTPase ObgE [Planctomycetota bacterium]
MFVDEARIMVKAGDGGSGCVSFRREKYVPKGGPDGGDGGSGGDVIFVVDPEKNTLLDFAGRHHWKATDGKAGSGQRRSGKSGDDLVISVPPGTGVFDLGLRDEHEQADLVIPDEDDAAGHEMSLDVPDEFGKGEGLHIADLVKAGQQVIIAEGGRGGQGNHRFKSSTNQSPRQFTPGTPGVRRHLRLQLRLIADVGLAGLPNAGKSTLLGALSAARPKVASYPFTTLEPQLGISELDFERRIVFADIPGLIEGASDGAGLGHAFLKHIERCRVVLHVVDVGGESADPAADFRTVRRELERFSPTLAEKPTLVAANKIDLLTDGDGPIDELRQALPDQEVVAISGATRQGLDALCERLWTLLQPELASNES